MAIIADDKSNTWVEDSASPHCLICGCEFGFFNRRHHCRLCGSLVCASCSDNRATFWDEKMQGASVQRLCDSCSRRREGEVLVGKAAGPSSLKGGGGGGGGGGSGLGVVVSILVRSARNLNLSNAPGNSQRSSSRFLSCALSVGGKALGSTTTKLWDASGNSVAWGESFIFRVGARRPFKSAEYVILSLVDNKELCVGYLRIPIAGLSAGSSRRGWFAVLGAASSSQSPAREEGGGERGHSSGAANNGVALAPFVAPQPASHSNSPSSPTTSSSMSAATSSEVVSLPQRRVPIGQVLVEVSVSEHNRLTPSLPVWNPTRAAPAAPTTAATATVTAEEETALQPQKAGRGLPSPPPVHRPRHHPLVEQGLLRLDGACPNRALPFGTHPCFWPVADDAAAPHVLPSTTVPTLLSSSPSSPPPPPPQTSPLPQRQQQQEQKEKGTTPPPTSSSTSPSLRSHHHEHRQRYPGFHLGPLRLWYPPSSPLHDQLFRRFGPLPHQVTPIHEYALEVLWDCVELRLANVSREAAVVARGSLVLTTHRLLFLRQSQRSSRPVSMVSMPLASVGGTSLKRKWRGTFGTTAFEVRCADGNRAYLFVVREKGQEVGGASAAAAAASAASAAGNHYRARRIAAEAAAKSAEEESIDEFLLLESPGRNSGGGGGEVEAGSSSSSSSGCGKEQFSGGVGLCEQRLSWVQEQVHWLVEEDAFSRDRHTHFAFADEEASTADKPPPPPPPPPPHSSPSALEATVVVGVGGPRRRNCRGSSFGCGGGGGADYDAEAELKRQGLRCGDGNVLWRVTRCNEAFTLCESYPCLLVVPAFFSQHHRNQYQNQHQNQKQNQRAQEAQEEEGEGGQVQVVESHDDADDDVGNHKDLDTQQLDDAFLTRAVHWRAHGRLPAMTWTPPPPQPRGLNSAGAGGEAAAARGGGGRGGGKAPIFRASQPLVGAGLGLGKGLSLLFTGFGAGGACPEDEELLRAVRATTMMAMAAAAAASSAPVRLQDVALLPPGAEAAAARPTDAVLLQILDVRPVLSAKANAAMGLGGHESVDRLGGNQQARLSFGGVPNIHAVRRAFSDLKASSWQHHVLCSAALLHASVGASSVSATKREEASSTQQASTTTTTTTKAVAAITKPKRGLKHQRPRTKKQQHEEGGQEEVVGSGNSDAAKEGKEIVGVVAAGGGGETSSSLSPPGEDGGGAVAAAAALLNKHQSAWLAQVGSVLSCSLEVAAHSERGHPTLVHCSDGWDRTAQVVSLAQFFLDPFYRTLEGFQVLVEKDWCSFGHQFDLRCSGPGANSHSKSKGRGVGGGGGVSATRGVAKGGGSKGVGSKAAAAAAAGAAGSGLFGGLEGAVGGGSLGVGAQCESSPVFLQFLDAVWQVLQQFPSEVEFNEALLLVLADEAYARFSTNFRHDNDAQRYADYRTASRRGGGSAVGDNQDASGGSGGGGGCEKLSGEHDEKEEDEKCERWRKREVGVGDRDAHSAEEALEEDNGVSVWRHVRFCRHKYVNDLYVGWSPTAAATTAAAASDDDNVSSSTAAVAAAATPLTVLHPNTHVAALSPWKRLYSSGSPLAPLRGREKMLELAVEAQRERVRALVELLEGKGLLAEAQAALADLPPLSFEAAK